MMTLEAKSGMKIAVRWLIPLVLVGTSLAQTVPVSQGRTNQVSEVTRILRQASQAADSLPDSALKTKFLRHFRQVSEMADQFGTEAGENSLGPRTRALHAEVERWGNQGVLDRLLAPMFVKSPDADVQERAAAQAGAGNVAGAIQTAVAIEDDHWRSITLRNLALCAAKAGDTKGAIQIAEAIPAKWLFLKAKALAGIAAVQAKAGDRTAALQTAMGIAEDRADASFAKAEALAAIATVQAKAEDRTAASSTFQEAIRVLDATQPELGSFAATCLSEISIAQANAGDKTAAAATFQNSLRTANAMPKEQNYGPYSKANALMAIAGTQARSGSIQGALQAAAAMREIPAPPLPLDEYTREYWYGTAATARDVSLALAAAGDTAGALDWAGKLPAPGEKAYALLGAAEGMLLRIHDGEK